MTLNTAVRMIGVTTVTSVAPEPVVIVSDSPVPFAAEIATPAPNVMLPSRNGYTVAPPEKPKPRPGNGVSPMTGTGIHPSAVGRPTLAPCRSTANHGSRSSSWALAGAAARTSPARHAASTFGTLSNEHPPIGTPAPYAP